MFSIVIPLYNKEISINRTLSSVLAQSFETFEVIVVNDGSSDRSKQVVESFRDPRVRLIDKKNGGVSSARNRGVSEAKCEWIVFLDADDIWKSNHLETLSQLIQTFPQDRVFCTSYIKSSESPSLIEDDSIEVIDNYFKAAMKRSFFWTSVTCIHRSIFEEVGGFQVGFSRGEDVELWNRIGRKYRFIKSNLITATYNIDSENKLTRASFNYSTSTLFFVHEKFDYFSSVSEKQYYLKTLLYKQMSFLKSMNFRYALKTFYRFIVLLMKPVRN